MESSASRWAICNISNSQVKLSNWGTTEQRNSANTYFLPLMLSIEMFSPSPVIYFSSDSTSGLATHLHVLYGWPHSHHIVQFAGSYSTRHADWHILEQATLTSLVFLLWLHILIFVQFEMAHLCLASTRIYNVIGAWYIWAIGIRHKFTCLYRYRWIKDHSSVIVIG